jgi:hypothetical protein
MHLSISPISLLAFHVVHLKELSNDIESISLLLMVFMGRPSKVGEIILEGEVGENTRSSKCKHPLITNELD